MTEKKQAKNSKLKTFMFFLVLALVFWFFTKFSKDLSTRLTLDIQYTQVPVKVLISQKSNSTVSIDIKANGFQALKYLIKSPSLTIPVATYYKNNDTLISIPFQEYRRLVENQLTGIQIKNASLNEISIFLDQSITKKIPVRLVSKSTFKKGFRAVGDIRIIPDSLLITGPSTIIKPVNEVFTKPFTSKEIASSVSQQVPLEGFKNKNINLTQEVVELNIVVKEFSQKEVQVPVNIINVPADIVLKANPEAINVQFEVAVDVYQTTTSKDFEIICDYNEKISDGSFMLPKIIKKPEGVYQIELQDKKVTYLIFNQ